jgi:gluconolactonase
MPSIQSHPVCRVRQPGPSTPVDDVGAPATYDPRFEQVLAPGARLMSLYDQALWAEGPVWWPAREMLVWSDVEGRRLFGWRPDGAVDVLIDPTAFMNGNALDGDRLIHCEHGRRCVSTWDGSGEPTMLVTHYEGRRLNSPNDAVVAADGAIWFTDPTYGLQNPRQGCPGEPELDHRSVYRFEPGTGAPTRMADLEQPNGIAFAPDGRTLYVADSDLDRHEIIAFDVGDDHTLSNRRVFAVIQDGVPDGFAVDARGWVWTSSGTGVQVFSAEGEALGLIPTPHSCSNCTFGGTDGRRLFITGEESLWAIDLASDGSGG